MHSKTNTKYLYKSMFLILFIISILLFCSFVHPTFSIDEEYTMGLIKHNYSNLININKLDVHPPTYYLILKTFLLITTFWTHSLVIKILFGHILSLIAFIISFVVLCKIVKSSGIHIKYYYLLAFYLLFSSVSKYSTMLRMHGFSSLFNILELYELIQFHKNSRNKNIILATIYAIVASYMDYFSAVCAGVFILIYFIYYILELRHINCIKVLISGISLLLISIPLIRFALYQTEYRISFGKNSPSPIGDILINILSSFTQINGIGSLILLFPIIISLVWSFKNMNKKFNLILIIILSNYIISNTIAIIICQRINVYEPKFMYPQFSIYSFLVICIILTALKYNRHFIIFISLVMLIGLSSAAFIYKNIKWYDAPSITLIKNINNWDHNKSSKISLNYKHIPEYWPEYEGSSKQMYITQESLYLSNMHKGLILKGSNAKKTSVIVNGKTRLLKDLFGNIRYKE